eukprot:RCo043528
MTWGACELHWNGVTPVPIQRTGGLGLACLRVARTGERVARKSERIALRFPLAYDRPVLQQWRCALCGVEVSARPAPLERVCVGLSLVLSVICVNDGTKVEGKGVILPLSGERLSAIPCSEPDLPGVSAEAQRWILQRGGGPWDQQELL